MPVLLGWLIVSVGVFAALDVAFALERDGVSRVSAGVPALAVLRRGRGRPRKFPEASRTVTLTLPESVIATLSAIHHDLSRAVVGLTRRDTRDMRANRKAADLLVFGRRAVITVRPTPSLEQAGVQLVPLPDGRALIAFDDATSLSALQLSMADALDDGSLSTEEKAVYEKMSEILREARQSGDISLEARQIIVLEAVRGVPINGR